MTKKQATNSTLRTKKTENIYRKVKEERKNIKSCPLCNAKTLIPFKYWRIVKNNFPYDKIAASHHMILPVRHVVENDLNDLELKEFKKIKKDFLSYGKYDSIIEATQKNKTIPNHFHLHLITLK